MDSSSIGRHTTYFEAPDILFMRLVGPVSEAEAKELDRLHLLWAAPHQRVFFLLDLSGLDSIDPEGRKDAGRTVRELPLAGVAVYGAPMKAKVLAKLVFTAMNLFKANAADRFPIEFLKTEAEARAWIEQRRSTLGPVAAGRAVSSPSAS